MSTTRARQEAMLLLCAFVAKQQSRSFPDHSLPPGLIARKVYDLAKIARSLHKRYEAACSYEWANTRAYEKRTERLEAKAVGIGDDLGVVIELQPDPRGWPLIIYSRGGKSNTNPPAHSEQQEIVRLG